MAMISSFITIRNTVFFLPQAPERLSTGLTIMTDDDSNNGDNYDDDEIAVQRTQSM